MLTSNKLKLRLPRLHPSQQEIKQGLARFSCICAGRRWGKDVLNEDRIIEPALLGHPVAWFSPSYPMHTEVWRTLKNILQPVTARVDSQQHRIELITGGVLDLWSLDAFDSARGRKYKRVIVNEAAMVPHLQEAWEAVIRPTLTDLEGDAIFSSTPKGRNYFHTLYLRGQAGVEGWRTWQKPTSDNPLISPLEIEAARRDLPADTFEQEYLAMFVEGSGSVFRNITACLNAPQSAPEAHQGHNIVMGVDWAQKRDYSCLSALCVTCMAEVEIDRFNQIGWDLQRGRLAAMADRWSVSEIVAEENSIGSPNIEALQNDGYPVVAFQTTATSKPPLIKSLVLAFERQEVQWQPDSAAKAELEAYEATVSATTGRVSYSAPEGMHDDSVIARALALYASQHSSQGVFF